MLDLKEKLICDLDNLLTAYYGSLLFFVRFAE